MQLMAEVSGARKHHGYTEGICLAYALGITDRPARLNDRNNPGTICLFNIVRKWQKCVRCHYTTCGRISCNPACQVDARHAIWLSCPHPDQGFSLRKNNGIRLDVLGGCPRKKHVFQLCLSRLASGYHIPVGNIRMNQIRFLDQNTTRNRS